MPARRGLRISWLPWERRKLWRSIFRRWFRGGGICSCIIDRRDGSHAASSWRPISTRLAAWTDREEIFQPKIEGGRVWGRGACDTKGSVAAMLTALFEVVRSAERPKTTEIIFAGLIDEESNQQGSRALVNSGFRADFEIVGEPTRLDAVTAHKGDIWARLGSAARRPTGLARTGA